MRKPHRPLVFISVAVMTTAASAVFAAAAEDPATEFEEASIVVERNDTDGDTEVATFFDRGVDLAKERFDVQGWRYAALRLVRKPGKCVASDENECQICQRSDSCRLHPSRDRPA